MTTNQTIDEIKQELERAANKDRNIKINYEIDLSVDFLDIRIMNDNSHLRTKIYHKSASEPYILPYRSAHARHIHRNIPYAAFLRAIRICSDINDFTSEVCHIDVALLLNGYPTNFIRKQLHRLLESVHALCLINKSDEEIYQRIHHHLLHQSTRRETKLLKMTQDPVRNPIVLQPKVWNCKVMYPHYLFDSGRSASLREEFMKWWKEHYAYPGTQVYDVKVRMIPDTQRTLETFFIHKKPLKEFLTRMN